jgi:hypothetical protein
MRQTQDAGVVEREQTVSTVSTQNTEVSSDHHPNSAGIQGLRPPMDMCMKYMGKYMYMS